MIVSLCLIALLIVLAAVYFFWQATLGARGGITNASPASTDDLNRFGLNLDRTTGPFLDPQSDHSSGHGHYLATACDLAYLPQDAADKRYFAQLNLSARLISFDNTQVYIGQNAESIVVAFRGSQTPNSLDGFKDWLLTNARNFLVLPEGRIGTDFAAAGVGARFHRGFMSSLDEIWNPLHTAVNEAIAERERPIWVTGHSLGGALALLAAWRFHQHFLPVHRICTFGAPMIGNEAAAKAYLREFPGKIIRYVDHSDMVPRLPATSLLSNEYRHVQREIVLGGDGIGDGSAKLLIKASAEQGIDGDVDEATANGLWGNLHSGISAHLMGNYISRISDQLA